MELVDMMDKTPKRLQKRCLKVHGHVHEVHGHKQAKNRKLMDGKINIYNNINKMSTKSMNVHEYAKLIYAIISINCPPSP